MESKGNIVGIVGLGLIGGSMALKLKQSGFTATVIGTDASSLHAQKALELGIVDKVVAMARVLKQANVIVLAIPVDATKKQLPLVLDALGNKQVVLDVGSTKANIAEAVANHKNRAAYVACHPIAGTENTGPEAAFSDLFTNKVNIICDKQRSSTGALEKVLALTDHLGMRPKFMDSHDHDRHIAYVSHLSHISSFTLGQTVLEVEPSETTIFDMAGSGFESTVRLAKSSPAMWAPIFTENADNIIDVLSAYISNLEKYKAMIKNKNEEALREAMHQTNRIRKVLNDKNPNPDNQFSITNN